MDSRRAKPTTSVKLASLFFIITGLVLLLGFIKATSEIPLKNGNFHIFTLYIFLFLLCFFISFGLYMHKKWSLYVGYAFGSYLIINFFINISSTFPEDVAITGIPILLLVILVLYLLMRKHHHFIN